MSPEQYGHPFPKEVVKLKYFHRPDAMAAELDAATSPLANFRLVDGTGSRKLASRKDRRGQSAFRREVLTRYDERCCITSEGVVELLEAAHIQPYVDLRSNHPQNGLCLRVDLHRLFDEGLITISSDSKMRISKQLAHTSYAALDGAAVRFPCDAGSRPSEEALDFHRTKRFR